MHNEHKGPYVNPGILYVLNLYYNCKYSLGGEFSASVTMKKCVCPCNLCFEVCVWLHTGTDLSVCAVFSSSVLPYIDHVAHYKSKAARFSCKWLMKAHF